MTLRFPSEEWTRAFKDAVNNNPNYRTAGKEWTYGKVAFIVKSDAARGLENDIAMILDVDSGTCRDTHWVTPDFATAEAPFVIVGVYERWQEVLSGKEDPIKSMMQGKLKLTKGHLPTIIKYVDASRQLVKSAMAIPTEFVA